MKTWKQGAAATLLAFAASYSAVVHVAEPPATPVYAAVSSQKPCGLWCKTKRWVGRHPTLSGCAAGAAAGTAVFPGVGTVGGVITGCMVGAQIGDDERSEEDQDREAEDWEREREKEEQDKAKPPEAERKW